MSAPLIVSGDTMSYEEFLVAYDGVHAEWVSGCFVPEGIAADRHQDVVGFLAALARFCAEASSAGIIRSAPFPMRIGRVSRAPDVLFVTAENQGRILPAHLEGPADLVIEVISAESAVCDRGEKFFDYEEAGVREAWFIDPLRNSAEVYRPDARGIYTPVHLPGDRLRSEILPGFWIDPLWLWSNPLPTLMSVLGEWGLASTSRGVRRHA